MKSSLEKDFPELFQYVSERGSSVVYVPKFREFALKVLNGPSETYQGIGKVIDFCPFSGKALPPSLREQYFDHLESLGIEDSDSVPEKFSGEVWWLASKL